MEANTKAEGESRLPMPRVPNSGNMVGASVDRNVPFGNRYGPDGCTHRIIIKRHVTNVPTTPTIEKGAKAARFLILQSGHKAVIVTANIEVCRQVIHPVNPTVCARLLKVSPRQMEYVSAAPRVKKRMDMVTRPEPFPMYFFHKSVRLSALS
jgi:hypothetical protein